MERRREKEVPLKDLVSEWNTHKFTNYSGKDKGYREFEFEFEWKFERKKLM